MPLLTNNTQIDLDNSFEADDRETMIKIDDVSMSFNMASEKLNNLKEYFISIVRHNLFYKELKALQNISFEIKRGDVFGIVGTNGSGKSTLLKIVAGVLEPSEGSVEINGAIAPLIELGAGFDMDLSARENIYLNGALLGYNKEFIDQHFDSIVEFAEVEKFLDMPMKNYSSGMIARIAFAIATVMVPEILIVDEVLSVGDFMFQKKCEDRILDLIEHHNTTVLIVSHSNEQVARLCNKAIWIEKGKTRMIGEAEKVCGIYGLVGGRLGSLKAESEIITMSEKMPNEDCSDIAFYSEGATYGDIALNLAKHACQKDIETICVCSNLTHVGCAVANSIAGAYNAPLLSIDHSTIDHFVLDWIEDVKPKRLIIVDHGHATSCATLASHKFDFDLEIINITGELNCANFSLLAYNKLLERGVNLNEPIVAYLENSLALDLLLARESYENVRPIIVLEGTNLENPSNVIDWLKVNNFKAVSILNDETLAPVVKTLEDNNISCEMLFNDEDELDFMSMAEQLSVNKEYQEAVVSPYVLGNFASATSAGYYCTKKNACCIIVDDTSLDSIAKGIKFISDHKIKKLSFIQGAGALSDATSTLLSRIAKYNSLQQ